MTRPRLLDLFCGAGGCSVGYHRAGFDVVGVDNRQQPNYPYEFHQADAMTYPLDGFDVIHASPPCQAYSTITPDQMAHPRLIGLVRGRLREWGGLYVIENVEGARREMDHPVKVCGSSLGLTVRRHRYFESNAFLVGTPCAHNLAPIPIGVYGSHPEHCETPLRPTGTSRGVRARLLADAQTAMGIDWMRWDNLTDAIPPAYTEHLGAQLLDVLAVSA